MPKLIWVLLALILSALAAPVSATGQDYEAGLRQVEQSAARAQLPFWPVRQSKMPSRPQSVAEAHGLLIDKHTAAGVSCESCHVGGLTAAPPTSASLNATCVACHGTMIDLPAADLSSPNPHLSPHLAPGEVPQCTECHRVHEPGEVTCTMCHRGFRFSID